MLKYPNIITVCSVILAGAFLLSLPVRVNSQLKWMVAGVFLPFLGLAETVGQPVEAARKLVVSKQEILRENQRLRRELQGVKIAMLQKEAVLSENILLREAIGWKKKQPWRLLPARVLVQDPSNWWRSLYINVGTDDGVVESVPVLSPMGLVGKVEQVGRHRSLVRLVGDPHCRVAAMLSKGRGNSGDEEAHGTIMPGRDTSFNPRLVYFQHLPSSAELHPGTKVVTSGMGGGFPRGIHIGHIIDSRFSGVGLFAEARVRLTVDLNRLEMVWLKLPESSEPQKPSEVDTPSMLPLP